MTGDRAHRHDAGFTLIELLVVVIVLGFVTIAIAGAFITVIRTSTANEARVDDSRALLNLTNWISQDVSSTAETGFSVGDNPTGCLATSVPTSSGLMELTWQEGANSYTVNYRYVPVTSNTGTIQRFACRTGQAAQALKLTPQLRNVSSGALTPAPVAITLVPTTTVDGVPASKGLRFVVTVLDDQNVQRELLSLDATTTNVRTTLPPSGSNTNTNQPPTALAGTASVIVGSTVSYPMVPNIASDPDGDTLTVTLGTLPNGWNVTPVGTVLEITPDPSTAPGDYSFQYTVTDPGALSAANTITITVTPVGSNQPPIANPASVNANGSQAVTITLDATDPEGGNLTVALSDVPSGWASTINGLDVTITPTSGATGSSVVTYTVTDPLGAATTSTITVAVCTVTVSSVDPTSVRVHTNGTNRGHLQRDVVVNISTNSACSGALVLAFKPKAADVVETTVAFNAGNQALVVSDAYVWDLVARSVTLSVRQGANGPIEATGSLELTT